METTFDMAFGLHNKNGYFLHTLTALHSVLSRTSKPLRIHILHDASLDGEIKDKFIAVSNSYETDISFHALDSEIQCWPMPDSIENFSPGCLFRLFIPGLFPDRKILYIDSDTIMAADPVQLFKIPAADKDKPIWAVRDDFAARDDFKSHVAMLGLESSEYFNSGVMFFNNPALTGLFPDFWESLRRIAEKTDLISFPDQDVLNSFFSGPNKPGFLSAKSNFQIGHGNRRNLPPDKLSGKLVHYTWRKPWETVFPAGMLYWEERKKLNEIFESEGAGNGQ